MSKWSQSTLSVITYMIYVSRRHFPDHNFIIDLQYISSV